MTTWIDKSLLFQNFSFWFHLLTKFHQEKNSHTHILSLSLSLTHTHTSQDPSRHKTHPSNSQKEGKKVLQEQDFGCQGSSKTRQPVNATTACKRQAHSLWSCEMISSKWKMVDHGRLVVCRWASFTCFVASWYKRSHTASDFLWHGSSAHFDLDWLHWSSNSSASLQSFSLFSLGAKLGSATHKSLLWFQSEERTFLGCEQWLQQQMHCKWSRQLQTFKQLILQPLVMSSHPRNTPKIASPLVTLPIQLQLLQIRNPI